MREGLRYAIVVLLIVMLAGCSAARRRKSTEPEATFSAAGYSAMAGIVKGYNITDEGFVIRRGKVELQGTQVEGTFGFTARINRDGDFLASVRGPLGIELVRILAVGNEIAAIDRFNRTVYIGKRDVFMQKNGMPRDFVEMLFGDMPELDSAQFGAVNANELIMRVSDMNTEREVVICVDEMKVCRQSVNTVASGHEITMHFSDFKSAGDKKYATHIEMNEKKKKLHVTVKIDELVTGFDEEIVFNLPSYRRSNI
ncbi:MAG: DUF4292 domain-containing protein [Bacteroidales bacterium]|nr:DUF4292 domain-containing protein [Bacteroidales bacterium]